MLGDAGIAARRSLRVRASRMASVGFAPGQEFSSCPGIAVQWTASLPLASASARKYMDGRDFWREDTVRAVARP
jgi:hypothetical protein